MSCEREIDLFCEGKGVWLESQRSFGVGGFDWLE
jgi:hypothetical protein